jgi:integrase
MNLNQVTIYFYVKPSTVPGKRGRLNVRITVNNKQIACAVKSFSMYPEEFDVRTQNPRKKCDLYFEVQNFMVGIRQEINRIHSEYERKKFIFTKTHLEKSIENVYYRIKHGQPSDAKTYLNIFDEFIDAEQKDVGKTLSIGTHRVRKRYKNIIRWALEETDLVIVPICNFTEHDVERVRDVIKSKYAVGTAARIYPVFKYAFNFAVKSKEITENPCQYVETVKVPAPVSRAWLEQEEVHALMNLNLTGEARHYRAAFIFCCYTGLSIGDYMLLNPKKRDDLVKKAESPKDIQPGEIIQLRLGKFLIGKRRKTGTMFRVPIGPEVEAILEEYGGIDHLPFNLVKISNMLNTFMNMIGSNRVIRFHTARKTMANYIINIKMINPYYVIEIMGWKKIEEAAPYTVVSSDTLSHQFFGTTEQVKQLL